LRIVNLILAVLLLVLIVIAVDPNARQKAVAFVNRLNNQVAVNTSNPDSDDVATPVPTRTPIATAVVQNDNDEVIPNTGDDTTNEPIIQINWDALGAALRRFWDELRNIRIEFRPNTTK